MAATAPGGRALPRELIGLEARSSLRPSRSLPLGHGQEGTIYTNRPTGSSSRGRGARALLLGLLVVTWGCDVEWGGARVSLENPAPEPEPGQEVVQPEGAPPLLPLPEGPLLWAVSLDASTGAAFAVPVARLGEDGPVALELPEPVTERFRSRLDSLFAPPGRELTLMADAERIGSLVLDGGRLTPRDDCPSVVTGRALLLPGGSPPDLAFATAEGVGPSEPVVAEAAPEPDNRIRTFGPILAEQLLRAAGETRPYLAQRADMETVAWPGDARPAMAATYLINDTVDGPPPPGSSASLFFIARFDPARGYVADWSEVRRYDAAAGKEVFVYAGAFAGPGGRVDVVSVHGASGAVRLGASRATAGQRRLDWTEGPACPGLSLLGEAAGEGAGAAPPPDDGAPPPDGGAGASDGTGTRGGAGTPGEAGDADGAGAPDGTGTEG